MEGLTVFSPEPSDVQASQLTAFVRFCESETGERFQDHAAFHDFSVRDHRRFWRLFLDWAELLHDGSPEPVCTDDLCERAEFFPNLELSYVENLLRVDDVGDLDQPALIARHADRAPERLSRLELRDRVRGAAARLAELGVTTGDRVAAVAPNNAEVVVAGLAVAALGATFSTAPPDMGVPALVSRFEQLAPKLLLANLAGTGTSDAALAELPARVAGLSRELPTLGAVVALDGGPEPAGMTVPVHRLEDAPAPSGDHGWPRFPFNHPLFILFTSGTTGSPKCLVHGAGGTLLEHVKEHRLHVDLGPTDTLFFHTSAAWMMWNWQLSALASGSTIVVYDGPVAGPETLWRIVSEERVTVFGTSPPYLQLCEDSGFSPRRELALPRLRTVLSTGSILHDSQYDWAREHVGALPLQSISGGTDIVGCFVLGNPNQPVRRGRIQCRSLGLDVQAVPSPAEPPGSGIGELVCRNPFPSRPLHILEDDGRRFHATYFEQNPGVWTHGDLIEIDDSGEVRMHGRSDGVVHVRGVRIGPAEIYHALRPVPDVRAAMAVEQQDAGSLGRARLVLLVVLAEGVTLDGRLTVRIRREIARYASPAHVPELVVEVGELPTTHSGKPSETAARKAVNAEPVRNVDALANPGSLDEIRRAVAFADERARELAGAPEAVRDGSTGDRLLAVWESVLGVAPLHPDDDFFDVGGTSLAAIRLFQAIYDRMGIDLPLSVLLRARTPAAMAAVIDRPGEEIAPALVLLRRGEGGRPLFLVHPLWGDVLPLRPLALALDTDRPVYGIQARGLGPRREPQTRVEDMARTYVDTLRTVQPTGPYAIAGYSFGGLVAFEMARVLAARGEEVDWLGLLDPSVHHSCLPAPRRWAFLAARPLGVVREGVAIRTRLARYRREGVRVWARLEPQPQLTPLLRRVEDANEEAFRAYSPGPYEGDAALFSGVRAIGDDVCDPFPIWRRVVRGRLAVRRVPGTHYELVSASDVGFLAEEMTRALNEPASQSEADRGPRAGHGGAR
jgi:acetoacetyl-CoA synthetase